MKTLCQILALIISETKVVGLCRRLLHMGNILAANVWTVSTS